MDARLIRRVKRLDRIADWVITAGGVFIIVSVLGILVLIAQVALPLFFPPESSIRATYGAPGGLEPNAVVGIGLDDYLETAFVLDRAGTFVFHQARNGQVIDQVSIEPPGRADATIRTVDRYGDQRYSLFWSDGGVSLVHVSFRPTFDQQGRRHIVHEVQTEASVPPVPDAPLPLDAIARYGEESGLTVVRLLPDNRLALTKQVVQRSLFGEGTTEEVTATIDPQAGAPIGALLLNGTGDTLYAATDDGLLMHWNIEDPSAPRLLDKVRAFDDRRGITSLALLLGGRTLLVGDEAGNVTAWFAVPVAGTGKVLRPVHTLRGHEAPVVALRPAHQDRMVLSRDATGHVQMSFVTNERYLLGIKGETPLTLVGLNGRDNGLIGLDAKDRVLVWSLDIPYPEASLETYFGKVWYEGFPAPAYVWQSSAATDSYEPKLSLVPLIFGTIKGTFYGMLFAAPLAVFSAMYTSHLMSSRMRRWVKPSFEIMGAVPTVVIGFLAALWLAPIMHASLTAFFLAIGVLPLTIIGGMAVLERLALAGVLRKGLRGYEFLLMVPIVVLGAYVSFVLGHLLDAYVLGSDLPTWLFDHLGVRVDQRNSIVISFALGFAVLPIVYTIADDALTNVPRNLTAASLALGATRWQTVWRVVLPSASPGVFAALMVGFGRAVGETMIVLMATGNTPIMDWSPFNGMRTLSANIAVEIPEAPFGGTLYRTLFLSAVLLFVTTFVLNSVAEVVRVRLRKKFGQY